MFFRPTHYGFETAGGRARRRLVYAFRLGMAYAFIRSS
jgi:hypothetical protein